METTKTPNDVVKAAERAFLGSLMLDATNAPEYTSGITGPMFTTLADETIYNAIAYTLTATGTTDPIVVTDYLTQTGKLSNVIGGASYIHQLLEAPSSPALAPHYAQVIRTAYQGRQLTNHLNTALLNLTDGLSPESILSILNENLDELTLTASDAPTLIGETLTETADALEQGLGGLATGIRDFDTRFGGLGKATLNLFAGRPGMGKTVVALALARNLAKTGAPVLFYSLEMSRLQMLTRIIAAECRIPTDRLNLVRPKLTEQDWGKINEKAAEILDMPLYVEELTSTLEGMSAQVKAFRRKYPNMVLIVDYLGLMGTTQNFRSEQEQLTHISKGLKQLSRTENIPVVALAQLNRSSESRGDHTPQLSDLRGSGSLEQDADNVFLLYREDYYEPESPRAGELDIIGAKIRAGAPGTVSLAAQMHYMNVADMARD